MKPLRISLTVILFVILCVIFATSAYPQQTQHGTVIDVGSSTTVMLAIRLPFVSDVPLAVDYSQDSTGRTVWTSGSEWVLLPLWSPCINGVRYPIGLVTVCPPRPEGGHMDACVSTATGVLPLYRGSPESTVECPTRRRAVRH